MANTTAAKDAAAKTDESFDNVRDLSNRSVQQAAESFSRLKDVADTAVESLEEAYAKGSKSYKDLGQKSVEISRSNVNAHFDFLTALLSAKSLTQAIELQTSYARERLGVYAEQANEISSLVQKAVSENAKPLQDLSGKAFRTAQSAR
jgi:phasin